MSQKVTWSIVVFATAMFYAGLYLSRYVSGWVSLGAASTVTLAAVLLGFRDQVGSWLRGGSRGPGRDVWIGTAAGAGMIAATYGGYALLTRLHPPLAVEVSQLYSLVHAPPGPVRALPVLFAIILTEELVWRGALIHGLERMERPAWVESDAPVYQGPGSAAVVILAAVLYALPQLGSGSMLVWAAALGCGIIWSALRLWTGAIVAPLVAHVMWDLAVLVIEPLG